MDISPCLLLVILIHGLVLQTSHASTKLPVMPQALDVHDMDTVKLSQPKLSAQMKVEIGRRIGKPIR
ncbi:Uncharacterized protein TCM_026215 [Theobroma cacao]|uniref:Uncharacterized protein n=1 Tax=Theobroma cacao TaxID=3641 RepID=A0A061F0S8_THECC|nr:Uncharacterized protein TCM_026215 [Theobroma cacao]